MDREEEVTVSVREHTTHTHTHTHTRAHRQADEDGAGATRQPLHVSCPDRQWMKLELNEKGPEEAGLL
ncbi:hypothetical protein MHYP_G00237510 [Metynnis hypsauchen]